MPNNLFDNLVECNHQLTRLYSQWAQQQGFTANEFFILYKLGREGQCSLKALGEEFSLPKQTLTSVCQQLAKKGYVEYFADEHDKRGKWLQLNDAAQDEIQHLIARLTQIETTTQQDFGADNFEQLLTQFKALNSAFEQALSKG